MNIGTSKEDNCTGQTREDQEECVISTMTDHCVSWLVGCCVETRDETTVKDSTPTIVVYRDV